MESNSIHVSRDVVFHETIFPFASTSSSSHFSSDSSIDAYHDSFVFPHSIPDYSFSDSFFQQSLIFPSAESADTVSANHIPPPSLQSDLPHTTLDLISETDIVFGSVPRPNSPLNLRKSTKPHKPPSYLQDYSCQFVTSKPLSGEPYDIFACLTYANLSKNYRQFVMAVDSSSPNPTSFSEAVQSFDWRAAMDKEIAALELTNTWTLTTLPPGKVPIG